MFKNVLIAEDHESTNISLQKTVIDLGITGVLYAYYCDDALLHIKRGDKKNEPYELLITDLSFDPDGRSQQLAGGAELIAAARALQPDLKVLVFSAENRSSTIAGLFDQHGINGFVQKGRRDAEKLKAAIAEIFKNKRYIPEDLRQVARQHNAHNFTAYDITVLKLLSGGMLQKEIPAYLQAHQISPSGLSSLEKRLNLIKESLGFFNNEQLIAYCKDKKLI